MGLPRGKGGKIATGASCCFLWKQLAKLSNCGSRRQRTSMGKQLNLRLMVPGQYLCSQQPNLAFLTFLAIGSCQPEAQLLPGGVCG